MRQIEGMEPDLLRAYRRNRGWTREQLAQRLVILAEKTQDRRLGATGALVGRWERGEQRPGFRYRRLLCTLFGTNAADLGIVPFPPGCSDACERPEDLPEEAERPRLLHLIRSALGIPSWLLPTPEGPPDRLARAVRACTDRDRVVLTVVSDGIALAWGFGDATGPRAAVAPVLVQQDLIRVLLEEHPSEPRLIRLVALAAEVAQLLGWLALDMNANETARRCLDEGLRLARMAGAAGLAAKVLGHLSLVATAGNRPDEGLAFAEEGRREAGALASARTRSLLAVAEAGALASLGDSTGAEKALRRARATLARPGARREPAWMFDFNKVELEGLAGAVCLNAGLVTPARRALERALTASGPVRLRVRDRARWLAQLGQTYVLDGDVDEACHLAHHALALAICTRSDRGVLHVRALRARLSPWESDPRVREFDEALAAVSPWCSPITS